ncbi:hypothetical protein [Inquilinus limosus]|uniref:hypothetical protein n=1 Tax=Inquilinus limosus TaxID=171674 RepID=UPI00126A448E|nr:hypothetical protein [Inquilinus limosus]
MTKVITSGHPNFEATKAAIKAHEWDRVPDLVDVAASIRNYLEGAQGRLVLDENGNLTFDGAEVHHGLVGKIIDIRDEGHDPVPLVNFLERLLQNPSKRSLDQFYNFIERNHITIQTDGMVVAYKGVRDDYKDEHSGTFDNSIGKRHSMPRNQVDDDADRGCSYGFHVGSYDYVKGFGHRKMLVRFDPKDVVSVPHDANCTKIRVSEYEVIGEVDAGTFAQAEPFKQTVIASAGDERKVLNELRTYSALLRALADDGAVLEETVVFVTTDELETNDEIEDAIIELDHVVFNGLEIDDWKLASWTEIEDTEGAVNKDDYELFAVDVHFFDYNPYGDDNETVELVKGKVWAASRYDVDEEVDDLIQSDVLPTNGASYEDYETTIVDTH